MKITTKIWLIITGVLLIGFLLVGYLYKKEKKESKRGRSNVENLLKATNEELTLSRKEFSNAKTTWKYKVDSLQEANKKLKLDKIKTITLLHVVYRDTGSVFVLHNEPIPVQNNNYKIPVSVDTKCWGMKGYITSTDKAAKLNITERMASNDAQLLVTRSRFLGFLWWRKDAKFEGYNDCGKLNWTKIDFVNGK